MVPDIRPLEWKNVAKIKNRKAWVPQEDDHNESPQED